MRRDFFFSFNFLKPIPHIATELLQCIFEFGLRTSFKTFEKVNSLFELDFSPVPDLLEPLDLIRDNRIEYSIVPDLILLDAK